MNLKHTDESQQNEKISVNQMWTVIEKVLAPCDSMPDKTKMSEKQIWELYHIIKDADEMFRMLAQISELRKAIDKLNKK